MSASKQEGNAVVGCLVLLTIAGAVIGIVMLVIAVVGSGDEYDPPNDKYTYAECEGLRVVAIDNDNPNATDAAVQYKLYCQ